MANYHITDSDELVSGGAKTKAKRNIAAIQLLKELEQGDRSATPQEQAILIGYSGWGAAADIFTTKPAWAELKGTLEATLTEAELAAARASTVNAFYTDVDIATEIYKGIEQLGFSGGTILDPSMGATGVFEGTMPLAMARNSKITGIELDSLSGRIASQLYPDASIYVQGFQDVALADEHFDLTISNVPFSEIGVSDPRYRKQPVNTLHDYFFAKGLDKVRPGGLLVYITSTGTMQSAKGEPFRRYLSDRANLVGAMRLPGDAFKQNAGTEVTTDLIILQKLGDGVSPNGIAWTELKETAIVNADGKPLKTNQYYAQRPELMLGELSDDKLYPGRLALKGDGRNISEAIRQAFETMPTGIYQKRLNLVGETQRTLVPPELQSKVKQDAHVVHNGELMVRTGDYLEPAGLKGKPYERVIGLINVREAVQTVFDIQLQKGTDSELEAAQAQLIETYDSFVKKHGYISQRGNKLAYASDPNYPLLRALEKYDPEEKTAKKTDIFFKRTIQAYQPKDTAANAKEGLLFSLNEFGKVDTQYIAQLTSKSRLEVVLELQKEQLIFLDPATNEWQTKDEYLSGNVKQKLAIAQAAAAKDNQLSINVEALQAVQPDPLLPGDIDVRLGSVWVPSADVEAFAHNLLGIEEGLSIQHSKHANTWYVTATNEVKYLEANTTVYGTDYASATKLIDLALNLKSPTIYKTDPHDPDRRVIDQDETAAARLKQEEIKEKFKDWIWNEPERTDRLTNIYNETFNTNRERHYDGSHLELPGKNPNFVLRKHQSDAVYRSLSGNMLLAHVVGAGKTAEMICSAMEQKRLGLANKPMFVVPNHLLEQIAGDIKYLYPTANILAATKKDSSAAERQQLMARIATGQWDAVVVTHTAFEKLKLSEQAQTNFLQEEYEQVRKAILSVDGVGEESRRVMKDLEKKKTSLQERINAIAKSPAKDNTITFEQLGIDLLIVDESHYFKNLGYVTKMRNIAGLPNTESKRAFDMHMKVRYMAEVRGEGKGVIFATGTPIANSMAELYTVQRYLQPKELERMGLASFDDWASVFGETVTSAELSATGKFQVKTRFSSFVNMPELMGSVRQVMDIQTADMLKLPVPELAGGKPTVIAVPATNDQLAYMDELVERAENMRNVDPSVDNMLKLTGNGRSASADMRLLFPEALDMPNSKINRFVRDAFKFWKDSEGEKTHLVFCDLGTPKKSGQFSLYQDIKDKLIAKGIPEEEIAFAQDYKTDAQKLKLQQDFNKGKISILLSGAQLETGFNGQRKLARISHLTVPWRPDQIEQRDGRMVRQGNQNSVVESLRYVTQGRNGQPGIDGYFWQTLETKAGFISQVMKGSSDIRRMSDVSSEALNYSEIKAIATGNPLIMEMATLDNTIRQLSAQKRAHTNSQYRIRERLNKLPKEIDELSESIRKTQIDHSTADKAQQENKVLLFGKQLILSQEDEIGKRIRSKAALLHKNTHPSYEEIGALGGFKIHIQSEGPDSWIGTRMVIAGENHYYYDGIVKTKAGAYAPLRSLLESDIAERLDTLNKELVNRKKDLKDLSQQSDQPFPKEAELAAATKRLAEVHQELNADIEKEKEAGDRAPGTNSDASTGLKGSPRIETASSARTRSAKPRVAPREQQKNGTTERVAAFITAVGLEHDILSKDGFYLTLKHTTKEADLVIDAEDGQRIKLTTDVQIGSLPKLEIAAAFQVDEAGILTLDSIQATGEQKADEQVLAARLAHYLSTNQYTHQAQPIENRTAQHSPEVVIEGHDSEKGSKIASQAEEEAEKISVRNQTPELTDEIEPNGKEPSKEEPSKSHKEPTPRNEGKRKAQSEIDQDRVFVRRQSSHITTRIASFLVKHELRKEILSSPEMSTSFKDPRNGALTTFTTRAVEEKEVPDYLLKIGSRILTVNSNVDIGDGDRPVHIEANFFIEESGNLRLRSLSSLNPEELRRGSLDGELSLYLGVKPLEKLPPLEIEAQKQTIGQSETNNPVVLTIKSLYSGEESQVVLPTSQSLEAENPEEELPTNQQKPDTHSQRTEREDDIQEEKEEEEKTNQLEVYKSEFITISRNPDQEGIEVRFSEKPSEEWTEKMGRKGLGFNFTKKGGDARWYKKESKTSIHSITSLAQEYSQTMEATSKTPSTKEKKKPEIENYTSPKKEQSDTKEESNLRPGFKRHLEWKEIYPDAIILIKTPTTYYEAYKEDAVAVSKSLETKLSTVSSQSPQRGRVSISRIFENNAEAMIAKLQRQHSVVAIEADNTPKIYQKLDTEVQNLSVKEPRKHAGRAERNFAKFIHAAGLPSALMQGEDFHLKIENGSLMPLVLESHYAGEGERLLYATHYIESQQEKRLDSEAVFVISSEGELKLEETATQNPLGSGELRQRQGGDRTFANAFTKTLLQQGYPEAAMIQAALAASNPGELDTNDASAIQTITDTEIRSSQNDSEKPHAQKPTAAIEETNTQEPRKIETLASTLIQKTIEQHEPQLHLALTAEETPVTVEVESLRDWYAAVMTKQKQGVTAKPQLLNIIQEKGAEAKSQGSATLTSDQAKTMESDINWFSSNHPKTTVGDLRAWYRANTAISGGNYTQSIQNIATQVISTGDSSTQLRPADHLQMTKEITALQTKITAEIEPSLRTIWDIAKTNKLTEPHQNGQLTFSGKNYSITLTTDETLTLKNKQSDSELIITKSGQVTKNNFTLQEAQAFKSLAQGLTESLCHKQPAEIQA